jgi:hypothetical protein
MKQMDSLLILLTPFIRVYRWFQNRDWLPTDAVFSCEFFKCKGACPGFEMHSFLRAHFLWVSLQLPLNRTEFVASRRNFIVLQFSADPFWILAQHLKGQLIHWSGWDQMGVTKLSC